jgi:ribosomal protein S3
MGQKTNPIIFRLNNTKNWESKYFEKKSTENALYSFKDVEIRNFIQRFFDFNGLIIHELKLSYFNNSLHIFVSYFSTLKSLSLINLTNKKQKIKLINTKINHKNLNSYKHLKKNVKRYTRYKDLNYMKKIVQNLNNSSSNEQLSIIKREREVSRLRRVKFLKYYKNYLTTQNQKNIVNIKTNAFLNKFFESLSQFTKNKVNISLTLTKLNNTVKQNISKKKSKVLKKKLVKLRRYKQNEFFKEGINIMFLTATRQNSAKLLSQFIAAQLKKLKRHNFFLRFLKNTLVLFTTKTFSNLKGIKIKIKGRFNRAPRARHKIIEIGNGVPVLTLNSKLDYSETTAFTPNGTFGVKVWICDN